MSFYAIRVSGGILTEEFLESLGQPERLKELSLSRQELEERFYALLSLYERHKPLFALTDTSRAREAWLLPFFRALGFWPAYNRGHLQVADQGFPISHRGFEGEEGPPLHLVALDLDQRPGRREKSPQALLQAYLNLHPEQDWGILACPWEVRLLRKYYHVSLPGYVAFNLVELFEAPRDAALKEFQVLLLLLSPSRFQKGKEGKTPLDRYYEAARETGIRARDALRKGVVEALEALGNAFLTESLREELKDEERLKAYHGELLRLVYRLLFLLYAESRNLIPHGGELSWVYEKEYSVSRLRDRAAQGPTYGDERRHDLWEKLLLTFQLVYRGDERLGVPALNGELFAPEALPILTGGLLDPRERLENPHLPRPSNEALLRAVRHLTHVEREGALERINYRDLEVEEIGHVYEGILALSPRLVEGRYRLQSQLLERKASGSYYTPRELVQLVIRETLVPAVEARLKEAGEDPRKREEALLSLRVLDPAMGSGAFLISALEYLAERLLEVRGVGKEDPDAQEALYAARHEVAARCLYGVDLNPMAVELAKLSVWIAAAAKGRPLSFLDHHLKCGNSLVGAPRDFLERGVPKEAYKREGVPPEAAKALRFTKRAGRPPLGLDAPPPPPVLDYEERDVRDVEKKREAYRGWRESEAVRKWELLADYWTAAFFLRPGPGVRLPDAEGLNWLAQQAGRASLDQLHSSTYLPPATLGAIHEAKARHRFFHWWLEFPEVMEKGGFDVVLGNPPWEVFEPKEEEFFREKDPNIANLSGNKRKEKIKELEKVNPGLYAEWLDHAGSIAATVNFMRLSGRYSLTAKGDANTYRYFAELGRNYLSPRGRMGMVVPSGIATDDSTKQFFQSAVQERQLSALYLFNNAVYFKDVGLNQKLFAVFCLSNHPVEAIRFGSGLSRDVELGNPDKVFSLSAEDIWLVNPNTGTCPIFSTRQDAELTKAIYRRVPVLWREGPAVHLGEGVPKEENPWGVQFRQGLFNMTSDSHLFRTRKDLEGQGFRLVGNRFVRGEEVYLPLYEAKMFWHYDHRFAGFPGVGEERTEELSPERKADPAALPLPRYWVRREEVEERLQKRMYQHRWFLGFRDVTNATNERTVVVSFLPRTGVGHKAPLLFPHTLPSLTVCLFGNLISLALDYAARQKVGGTSLTFHYLKQFPVLPPSAYSPEDLRFIVPRVLELTYTAWDLAPLAQDVWQETDEGLREAIRAFLAGARLHPDAPPEWVEGPYPFPPFVWDEERRALLRAELDAYYARLYGLNRKQLRYILDPKDLTPKELEDILSDKEEVEDPLDEKAYRKRVEKSTFPGETFRVLKDKEMKRFGEYRTRRLVLEAWARLGAGN